MTTCLSVLVLLVSIVAGADETPAEQKPPVRVFLLAGQSNMVGAGQVEANPDRHGGMGSLEWLVNEAPDKARYAHLRNANGTWVHRDDVKIWYLGRTGDLAPGFPSLADVFVFPIVECAHACGVAPLSGSVAAPPRPATLAWRASLLERGAFAEVAGEIGRLWGVE